MMKISPTIAVARLLEISDPKDAIDGKATVEVSRVVKGTMKPGKCTIPFEKDGTPISTGNDIVIFLDEKRVWRFVAEPVDNKLSMDKTMLKLRGFFAFNAHIVDPDLITFEQLKRYIKDGSLVYHFRGTIYFPQRGQTDWKASSISISGSYDSVKNKATVKGMPLCEDSLEQLSVTIGDRFEGADICLCFSVKPGRGLKLCGWVESVDAESGAMVLRLVATAPEVLTEDLFRAYLGNSENEEGFPAKFKISCVPGQEKLEKRILTLTLGKDSRIGPDIKQLAGSDKEPIYIRMLECHGPDTNYTVWTGHYPKIVEEELARKDSILRMAAMTKSGDIIILAFDSMAPYSEMVGFHGLTWT